jgi:predicted ATPase
LPDLEQLQKADPNSAKLNFFVGHGLLETEQIEDAVPYLERGKTEQAKSMLEKYQHVQQAKASDQAR